MNPELPTLTYSSSGDDDENYQRYAHAAVIFLIDQDDAWGWDDWPTEDDNGED